MIEPRPSYGITRIDQPEKKNHGFYVRITHRGKNHQKYFPDELLAKMPKYKQEAASRKKRSIKQSGIVGVTHVVSKSPTGTVYEYWQAAWVDAEGKRKTAKFSITRFGSDKALEMAKRARKSGVKGKR